MATIITGKNTIKEAITVGRKVFELYVQQGTNDEILEMAKKYNIPVKEMSKQDINNLLPSSHQGVGASVQDYAYLGLDEALAMPKKHRLYLMLDGVEDPHNLGAMLRSCDAFNVDAVIIPKNRSVQLNATVAKVSTGAIEHVNVVQVVNLHQTIRKLKENGFWIIGTDMDTPQTMHEMDVDADICIVIGNEGRGLSRLVRDNCDYIVKIPMSGHINSLNASVSCALVLYEAYRRRVE